MKGGAIVKLVLLVILTYVWAFKIVDYFYSKLSSFWFLATFFFAPIFIWVLATHVANRILRYPSSFEIAVRESLFRNLVGYALILVFAGLVLFLVSG